MGNTTSVAEMKASPELKKYCYEAVDTLIKLDQMYKDEVADVKRAEPKGQNANIGSNEVKTWNITGKTSSVKIKQSTVLDTVVKTTIIIDAFTTMKIDPYVKVIICDLTGMVKETHTDAEMPSYSDPLYLLLMLGIKDVTDAQIVGDDIVYKDANGTNTKQPIQQVREYIHQYYIDSLEDKLLEAKNSIKQITNNITVCASNVASNELDITFRRNKNSKVNISQSNESVQRVEAEFALLADHLEKVANNKGEDVSDKTKTANDTQTTNSAQSSNSNNQRVSNNSPTASASVGQQTGGGSVQTVQPQQQVVQQPPAQPQSSNNSTVIIIIVVVVVIIVLGILGIAVFMSMQSSDAAVAQVYAQQSAYPPQMYGGFPINYVPITLH